MTPKIPTRQEILADFKKWTRKGSDSVFQFERAVRRWASCGYPLQEIPVLFAVTSDQLNAALTKVS